MRVLFIGNSFTYYNTLTGLLWEEAHLNGIDFTVEEITVGGYYLHQYIDPKDKHGTAVPYKLRQHAFDIVVLQDQSANPARNREDFLTAASDLCKRIRAIGGTPCFYQTWSYREGSEKLASVDMTYEGLYLALKDAYEEAARKNEALLSPVGTAFFECAKEHPEIDLYSKEDNYHPSLAGSYLAMLTFYRTLFGKEPEKFFVPEGLSEEICRTLSEV